MKRIYEPEYIKILRKSQFRGKDQLINFDRNKSFYSKGITDVAFEKIDKAFIVINEFIDKIYNKLEMISIDNKKKVNLNVGEIHTIQIYPKEPINNYSDIKKENYSNSTQINFQNFDLLNDKLASLLFNKVNSSNKHYQYSFQKKNYGLTHNETIQFKKSITNLINQINRDFSY
ncbi:uncharacterized protein cubi_00917 [Cryptosporidium ubiquitum]|uniref:Uncharacterized protein n=1 Tax=Cryptosporidium ubiquitum TaxID=857276 RepID=A0A1J4MCN4_9CRYT|nr:uncharacterized protein cubi_00917 [Cryptosporidium ubiquitum]OII70772.1 hypothetical protein cubi_00917 [Cryptosporidium ubiquitum]